MTGASPKKLQAFVHIAVFAAVIAVCAQLLIPSAIPFTMQTFGIFFAVVCLGGKHGTLAFLTYLLLGMIGIPVFSGFVGGIGVFWGPTGGYLLGYLAGDLLLWATERVWRKSDAALLLCMIAGLFACYLFGTIWYMTVYAGGNTQTEPMTVLSACVFPFLLPDIVKLALILPIKKQLEKARRFR